VDSSSIISPLPQVPTDLSATAASKLENKIRVAQYSTGDKQKNQLKKVSQEFESLFIAQLLKVMRETIEESGLMEGGFGKSIYTDLFDQEVARSMAKRGVLGISDLLYKNLSDKNSQVGQPTSTNPAPSNEAPAQTSPADSGTSSKPEPEISDLQLPVQAPVSSSFGMRNDPFSHQATFHKGVDLAAPDGTKVVAALPGTVISAGYETGYGNNVLIQHSGGLQTRYGHLGSVNVKAGDVVDSESVLGTVGSTGRSTGPHLHFEVTRMGKPVDPLPLAGTQAVWLKQRAAVSKMGS
jgi:murein DD-endopeptidase MepM/ murein hydrolase activator NlpD